MSLLRALVVAVVAVGLSACGGGGGGGEASYTIGGTVSGLTGSGLTLQDNGGDTLSVSADGSFAFPTSVVSGGAYDISVATQPGTPNQTCTVTNGSGTASANVTDVQVTCVTNAYTVSGKVSGLAGSGFTLELTANDPYAKGVSKVWRQVKAALGFSSNDVMLSTDGTFAFPAINDGSSYTVAVTVQPSVPNQSCTVDNATGAIAGGNVNNVAVTCTTSNYTIGGDVSGLVGSGLVLQLNGGNDTPVTSSGSFKLGLLPDTSSYTVTVKSQPTLPSQTCSVTNDSGKLAGGNVTNVSVVCVTNSYAVSGTVSGLAGGGLVLENGSDTVAVNANGTFTLPSVTDGFSYSVKVMTQPTSPNQTCVVANAGGILSGADVTNVAVSCTTNNYKVGGNVNGLAGTGLVLEMNGSTDVSVSSGGSFSIGSLPDGSAYTVKVKTQPTGLSQICAVTNCSGTLSGGDISNVAVDCTTNTYTVKGAVSGLNGSVTLTLNGANPVTLNASGAFSFPAMNDGSNYTVALTSKPATQNCTLGNSSGTLAGSDVTNVSVTCADITYTIGGTVSGLAGPGLVLVNGSEGIPVDADGSFTFPTPVVAGNTYAVTVAAQPVQGPKPAQTCRVLRNGSGTATGNVTNVLVDCHAPRFAYVANYADNTLSAYIIDAASGAMRPRGYVTTDGGPVSVSVDPSGKFAWAANNVAQTISYYSINQVTGALTRNGSISAAGIYGLLPSPSLPYAYGVDVTYGNVYQYGINGANGALTLIQAVNAGNSPTSLAFDGTGRFLYVLRQGVNAINAYGVNGATGALSYIGTFPTGNMPSPMTVDPTGGYLYVPNYGSNSLSVYGINSGSGALVTIGNYGTNGTGPTGVGADPSGRFVYVANYGSNSVSVFQWSAGALQFVGTVPGLSNPRTVTVDPSGQYAYVVMGAGSTTVFSINPGTGMLTQVSGAYTHGTPTAMAMVVGTNPVAVTTTHAYIGCNAFNMNGGALSSVGAGVQCTTGDFPGGAVDPAGSLLYRPNRSNGTIEVYVINANGTLGLVNVINVGVVPFAVSLDPTGRYAYMAYENGGTDCVMSYTVNGMGLSPVGSSVCFGGNALSAVLVSGAVDPTGMALYVAAGGAGVYRFAINTNGTLASSGYGQVFGGGSYPSAVTFDRTGRYAYVSAQYGPLQGFSVAANGAFAPMWNDASAATWAAAVDPSGLFLFVQQSGGALFRYNITYTTGMPVNQTSTGTGGTAGMVLSGTIQ